MKPSLQRRASERGYATAYYAILLAAVMLPLMALSLDITRLLYVRTHLQTAADAACEAAAQAVPGAAFNASGTAAPEASLAQAQASREFNATVADQGLVKYKPTLTHIQIKGDTVEIQASAGVTPLIPVTPALAVNAAAFCQTRANRH